MTQNNKLQQTSNKAVEKKVSKTKVKEEQKKGAKDESKMARNIVSQLKGENPAEGIKSVIDDMLKTISPQRAKCPYVKYTMSKNQEKMVTLGKYKVEVFLIGGYIQVLKEYLKGNKNKNQFLEELKGEQEENPLVDNVLSNILDCFEKMGNGKTITEKEEKYIETMKGKYLEGKNKNEKNLFTLIAEIIINTDKSNLEKNYQAIKTNISNDYPEIKIGTSNYTIGNYKNKLYKAIFDNESIKTKDGRQLEDNSVKKIISDTKKNDNDDSKDNSFRNRYIKEFALFLFKLKEIDENGEDSKPIINKQVEQKIKEMLASQVEDEKEKKNIKKEIDDGMEKEYINHIIEKGELGQLKNIINNKDLNHALENIDIENRIKELEKGSTLEDHNSGISMKIKLNKDKAIKDNTEAEIINIDTLKMQINTNKNKHYFEVLIGVNSFDKNKKDEICKNIGEDTYNMINQVVEGENTNDDNKANIIIRKSKEGKFKNYSIDLRKEENNLNKETMKSVLNILQTNDEEYKPIILVVSIILQQTTNIISEKSTNSSSGGQTSKKTGNQISKIKQQAKK